MNYYEKLEALDEQFEKATNWEERAELMASATQVLGEVFASDLPFVEQADAFKNLYEKMNSPAFADMANDYAKMMND